jgi:hypothetical protein
LTVLVETVETGAEKLVIVGRITPPGSEDDDDDDGEEEVCEFVLPVVIGGRLELDGGLGGDVVEELVPEDSWLELDEPEP